LEHTAGGSRWDRAPKPPTPPRQSCIKFDKKSSIKKLTFASWIKMDEAAFSRIGGPR
jgi:hypothetical protein